MGKKMRSQEWGVRTHMAAKGRRQEQLCYRAIAGMEKGGERWRLCGKTCDSGSAC